MQETLLEELADDVLDAAGLAVDGIWQHEQTVEDFYLGLINRQRGETK